MCCLLIDGVFQHAPLPLCMRRMVHGMLLDPFEESFILESQAAPTLQPQLGSALGKGATTPDDWHTSYKVRCGVGLLCICLWQG